MVFCDSRLETLNDFKCEVKFLKNKDFFQKTGATFFSWQCEDWKRNISIKKLPCQKPMLRQIEWEV